MILNNADLLIKYHEGFTPIAKPDAKGMWEVGYGFQRNPPTNGEAPEEMTRAEADNQFPTYRNLALARAQSAVGGLSWSLIDPVRQSVFVDMAYELGGEGLNEFHRLLAAARVKNWTAARAEVIASRLYDQVPMREAMNCQILATGEWPEV